MEFIVGVGRHQPAQEVIARAEELLREKEGIPRRIIAKTSSVEIVADRDDFAQPFDRFTIRARAKGYALECMEEVAKTHSDACSLESEEGWSVLRCPKDKDGDTEKAGQAVAEFSDKVNLPEVWRVTGDRYSIEHLSTDLIFQALIEYKASDIHLAPGCKAIFRVDGETRESDLMGTVSAAQILALIREVAPDADWAEFEKEGQASFNFHQIGQGYSRVSCFLKSGSPHLTFRFLPEKIPSFEDLNIPRKILENIAKMHHGLALVVGMTGSGKSTTVASLVDFINGERKSHILTIENPVEYVYTNRKSIVSQRATGIDVPNFSDAVRGALRHDPDVIVIGEMRDADTIRSAINAAATGHLVISTLHSNTAYEVVNRIVSFFDPVERDLVRLQLRDAMKCVICQRLVPKIGGGRVPAVEVMFNDVKPVNDGIILGDTDVIRIGMQQTVSHSFLFEEYLHTLYREKLISLEHAKQFSTDESILGQMLMGTYTVPRLDTIKHMGHV